MVATMLAWGEGDDPRTPTHSFGHLPIASYVVGLPGPLAGLLPSSLWRSHPRCVTPSVGLELVWGWSSSVFENPGELLVFVLDVRTSFWKLGLEDICGLAHCEGSGNAFRYGLGCGAELPGG